MSLGKLALMLGLVLGAGQPALCSLFTGPNTGLGLSFYNGAQLHNWDLLGLSLVNTPDGMMITGSMSATITSAEPTGYVSGLFLSAQRGVAAGTDLNLTMLAHQTGTVSSTGGINVTQVSTQSLLLSSPSPCSAFAFVDTGGNYDIGLSGSIGAGPVEASCQTSLFGGGTLVLYATVYYVVNGPGTITVDFGNSVIGEVRLNADTDVPEPSTLWLLSTIIPVAIYRRRHQPICRIRS